MNQPSPLSEYLVLSRGKWDKDASKADIEAAIGKFYDWISLNAEAGRLKTGQRLSTDGAVVSKSGIIMDGPFGETKEVVGGYWTILAPSLREAAALAAENPCLPFGLQMEIRPIEPTCASAYDVTNETPA